MSDWMYLKCVDHDPPIRAEEESGQHFYDLPRIRAEIEGRADLIARYEADLLTAHSATELNDYFPRHSARFLRQHPKCEIRIENEYGKDVTDPTKETP